MSESSEIIRRLVEGGANYESIGRAVGRNRSLIRQVGIGSKPGRNLTDALAELEARLGSVAPGERNRAARSAPTTTRPQARTTTRGGLANVRKPTTKAGASWSASTVKKAAVRNGARGLGHPLADAAEAGRQVAVTVAVDGNVAIEAYGSSRRGRAGLHGHADFKLGDADEVWETVRDEYGGDVTAFVADAMLEHGLVSGVTPGYLVNHIVEIDLRAF